MKSNELRLETYSELWDYELLDSGNGFRLERWGEAVLMRPDPQAIWAPTLPQTEWQNAHAIFRPGSQEDKGKWDIKKPLPDPWILKFQDTKFLLKLSPFKHTGIFAEQSAQWNWMLEKLQIADLGLQIGQQRNLKFQISNLKSQITNHKSKILNLFGYTGGATLVLAKAGCFVTHVDASKPAITWANENHTLNNLPPDSVRWILDDAVKFVKRELKRGAQYDGIIMDPPAFGHSPTGKTWKFNDDLPGLLQDSVQLLSPQAKFLLVNGYATNSSALALKNLLEDAFTGKPGTVEFGELCLSQPNSRMLSTGIFGRWSK